MLANWAYYRYLNVHDSGVTTTAFLIVVSILNAGRNALSFFLLLVVSLGLSVVRESLGAVMTRCKILAGGHFVFGVLYAIGIVELELESTSALVLLLFVIPLSFTLSGFLLWTMYALNGTIAELASRKQTYKLGMFKTLYRILVIAVIVIAAFFVVSSMSFSNRMDEDYAPESWQTRWLLLDGWLSLLYLTVFASIAFLWRPTGNNRRLAMSDELAQDEADADDYDLEAMQRRGGMDDDDEAVGGHPGQQTRGPAPMPEDSVVFEIGDSDDEEGGGRSAGRHRGNDEESQGLIGGGEGAIRLKDRND